MPYVIGEVEVINEVSLVPTLALYDGSVTSDGDLTVTVADFNYILNGAYGRYLGSVGNAVTNNSTNYVYLAGTGSLGINTTGYPTSSHIQLARVVASGGIIVRIIFERAFLMGVGPKYTAVVTLTSGGAEATLLTLSLADNTKYTYRVLVNGQALTQTLELALVGVFLRQGGSSATQKQNTTAIPNYADDPAWNPRLVASGNTVLIKATPSASHNTTFTVSVCEEHIALV